MVYRRQLINLVFFTIILVNCIPRDTCEDNLRYNKIHFENFLISKKQRKTRGEIYFTNSKDEKIKLIESFGILLFDVLQVGDTITKKKDESILMAKRGKYLIKFEMNCENENTILNIDTLRR